MTQNPGAIFHSLTEEPDWARLTVCPPQEAASAVKAILGASETTLEQAEQRLVVIRERIFNLRMICFRIVSERELWKLDIDPKFDVPFTSMYRWIECLYGTEESMRYALEADATQKALPAATVEDLAGMKRCNAVTLANQYVSDSCKRDPEMIQAAKTATEREFKAELNKRGQHIERTETRRWTLPTEDWKQIDAYLSWVASKADLDPEDKPGALLYLSIHELQEHE